MDYHLNRPSGYACVLRMIVEVAGVGAAVSAYYACIQSRVSVGSAFLRLLD